jgi:hypothetical protein
MNVRGTIAEGDWVAAQVDSSTEMKNGQRDHTLDGIYCRPNRS